jgi:hypothetical protein
MTIADESTSDRCYSFLSRRLPAHYREPIFLHNGPETAPYILLIQTLLDPIGRVLPKPLGGRDRTSELPGGRKYKNVPEIFRLFGSRSLEGGSKYIRADGWVTDRFNMLDFVQEHLQCIKILAVGILRVYDDASFPCGVASS